MSCLSRSGAEVVTLTSAPRLTRSFGFVEFRNADLATRLLRLDPSLISPSPDTYTSLHNPTLRPTRPPRSTNALRTTHPPSNTIQINNLHLDTTQQELYDTFDPFGTVWKCKMIRWQAAKGKEQRLSAYLGVRSVEAAELAIWKATSKEGIVLRGKRVHVQFAAPPKLKAKPAVGGEVEGEGGKAGGTKRGQGSAARAEQQRRDARWQEQQRKRRSEQRPRRVKEAEAEAESAAGSTSAGDPGLANLFRNW